MLNGRRSRFQRLGTAPADGQQFLDTGIQVAPARPHIREYAVFVVPDDSPVWSCPDGLNR